MDLYANSAASTGMFSGSDMTTPATFTKLAFLLANYSDTEEIIKLMKVNIAGEINERINVLHDAKEGIISYISNELDDLSDVEKEHLLDKRIVPCMAYSSVKYKRLDYLQECIDYNKDCLLYTLPNKSTIYHGASAYPDSTIIKMVNENLSPADRIDLVNRKNAQGYSPLSTAIIRHNKGAVNI